jgi:hypothetical protein
VALAMNAPMQLSSSNSLISLAMTSSPGKTTTGEQELWFRDGMRTAGFYCPDEGRPREPQAPSTGALLVRGDTRDRADRPMPPNSAYRWGRSPWIKIKNPNALAVKREAEEDWGRRERAFVSVQRYDRLVKAGRVSAADAGRPKGRLSREARGCPCQQ